jgi:colicin import membrane protein
MRSQVYGTPRVNNDFKIFFQFFTLSALCHVVFFGLLIIVPGLKMERKSTLSVINVSMVTLPAVEKIPEPIRKPPVETKKKKDMPPKPKVKTSLKKETLKPSKIVKHAIKKVEKKVEEARPDQVSQALDRLKENVEKTEAEKKPEPDASKAVAIPGGWGPDSKRALELLDIYRIEVAYQIQKNWAFSGQLAGGRTDLVAELAFTITPDGQIRDIWFDKRSGNTYLDESARKAILKSNPVRPHPKGIVRSVITVGLRFTPKGVR